MINLINNDEDTKGENKEIPDNYIMSPYNEIYEGTGAYGNEYGNKSIINKFKNMLGIQ